MYGTGTRSYNRSPERREMKRQVREHTAKFERGEIKRVQVEVLLCPCKSFRFGHPPSDHKKLLSDMDWRIPEQRGSMDLWEERIR